jgi:hypothetical protein
MRVGFTAPRTSVEARARLWFPQTTSASALATAEAHFLHLGTTLAGCLWPDSGRRWGAHLCAGPTLYFERGRARGISDPGAATAIWGGLEGDVGASLLLSGRTRLVGSVGMAWSLTPPIFSVDGLGVLHAVESLAPFGSLDLLTRF